MLLFRIGKNEERIAKEARKKATEINILTEHGAKLQVRLIFFPTT